MTSSDICKKAKTIVLLAVCVFWQSELRWLPYEDIGKPPLQEPNDSRKKYMEDKNLPYTPGAMWLLKPSLAFEASTGPVDTSAQVALAPHQATELKEFADTTFMAV
jgi:hypothetical protein